VPTTTVRVQVDTAQTLRDLAESMGRPMQAVLAEAVEAYSRRVMLEQLNEDFARLRADAEAWRVEIEERVLWESTLMDDLADGD
jgi:predicted transcriptional regulator